MSDDGDLKKDAGPFKLFIYTLLWFVGNALLVVLIVSCWKFGPLSKRGDIMFLAFLHIAVFVGLYKLHNKYFESVREFLKILISK